MAVIKKASIRRAIPISRRAPSIQSWSAKPAPSKSSTSFYLSSTGTQGYGQVGSLRSAIDKSHEEDDEIHSGWFSKGYEHVKIKANKGVVILTGSVETLDDKQEVEREVQKVDGVKTVKSNLRIDDNNNSY